MARILLAPSYPRAIDKWDMLAGTLHKRGRRSSHAKPLQAAATHHQTYYHMNLCTFPGSCGHANPQNKNTYPVPALIATNHAVSIQSR